MQHKKTVGTDYLSACQGKVKHETERDARRHLDGTLHRGNKPRKAIQTYQCKHCGKWHIGTVPQPGAKFRNERYRRRYMGEAENDSIDWKETG